MIRPLLSLILLLSASFSHAQESGTALRALDQSYEARGWEAVGRLDMNGAFCTATLISPSTVLSAAHCLYDGSGELRDVTKIVFNAGLRNGAVAATRRVLRMAAHPDFDPRGAFNAANISHDLALLELETPISSQEINPFVLHSDVVEPGTVSVVSYGRGRSDFQSRQKACELERIVGDVLLFNCDATFGSSGSPVFSHKNGRGRILSVISGIATGGETKTSVGPSLPPLVDTLKQALRKQTKTDLPPVANVAAPKPKPLVRNQNSALKRITVGQARQTGAKFIKAKPGS